MRDKETATNLIKFWKADLVSKGMRDQIEFTPKNLDELSLLQQKLYHEEQKLLKIIGITLHPTINP